jgi:hypothetical protein
MPECHITQHHQLHGLCDTSACGRKEEMSQWSNDAPEHKRLCPFREKSYCAATFAGYREMLAHCREDHPDRLPFGGDPSTEIVMMDTEGRMLDWEEVSRMLDHPLF